MGLKEGTCCSRVRKVLFTVSLTVSHHSETCGMNTTLGVLRRASRKTCKRHGRGSSPGPGRAAGGSYAGGSVRFT